MSVLPLTCMHNDVVFCYVDIFPGQFFIQFEGQASLMEEVAVEYLLPS